MALDYFSTACFYGANLCKSWVALNLRWALCCAFIYDCMAMKPWLLALLLNTVSVFKTDICVRHMRCWDFQENAPFAKRSQLNVLTYCVKRSINGSLVSCAELQSLNCGRAKACKDIESIVDQRSQVRLNSGIIMIVCCMPKDEGEIGCPHIYCVRTMNSQLGSLLYACCL